VTPETARTDRPHAIEQVANERGALAFDDDGEDAEVKAAATLLTSAAEAVCAFGRCRAASSGRELIGSESLFFKVDAPDSMALDVRPVTLKLIAAESHRRWPTTRDWM
jgi:hypothetical protein